MVTARVHRTGMQAAISSAQKLVYSANTRMTGGVQLHKWLTLFCTVAGLKCAGQQGKTHKACCLALIKECWLTKHAGVPSAYLLDWGKE